MDYKEILEQFKIWVVTDSNCQKLWEKVKAGKGTYKDADKYAEVVGKWWSKQLVANYGDADYSSVISDITDSIKKTYSESAYYSKSVQDAINKKSKIGMKALEPQIDEERIKHFTEKLIEEDAKFLLDEGAIVNISKSAIADTIQANARIQSKAGLYGYVERDTGSGCCEWCSSMAGRYEIGTQPKDFWGVHKDCTCTFDYKVGRTHTFISFTTNEKGKMTRNTRNI